MRAWLPKADNELSVHTIFKFLYVLEVLMYPIDSNLRGTFGAFLYGMLVLVIKSIHFVSQKTKENKRSIHINYIQWHTQYVWLFFVVKKQKKY